MKPAPTWADAFVSMVNAAVGDYLHGRGNGLHIPMAFYQHNRPLPLTTAALAQACPNATAKVCVLVHGLGCTEGIWHFGKRGGCDPQLSYGSMLQADGGYTPLYVRYNTGLSLEANGQHLDSLLQGLLELYPLPIKELLLIGHSMGGLVLRHGCGRGVQRGAAWAELVRRVFYLGSPHDG
ncbi:MAG: hypothetical protein MUD01_05175, partial [Chloroflexaceae bacterium]|nr:hypothetical protein [Chloroflexaceae bacterium]